MHEIFVDLVSVASAMSVCRGGASANGVRKSDGEEIVEVAPESPEDLPSFFYFNASRLQARSEMDLTH